MDLAVAYHGENYVNSSLSPSYTPSTLQLNSIHSHEVLSENPGIFAHLFLNVQLPGTKSKTTKPLETPGTELISDKMMRCKDLTRLKRRKTPGGFEAQELDGKIDELYGNQKG